MCIPGSEYRYIPIGFFYYSAILRCLFIQANTMQ